MVPKGYLYLAAAAFLFLPLAVKAQQQDNTDTPTYSKDEVLAKARGFFGATTEGLAKAIDRVFNDHGRPTAFIEGEEASGAFIVGLRYGNGFLHQKAGGKTRVYWQGPSVGFDFGGNASKVFTLVYGLNNASQIFQRFPGVEGSFYFVAGVGLNYQKLDNITLAPIRTGVGLRAGANIGYLHYNPKHSWFPF